MEHLNTTLRYHPYKLNAMISEHKDKSIDEIFTILKNKSKNKKMKNKYKNIILK